MAIIFVFTFAFTRAIVPLPQNNGGLGIRGSFGEEIMPIKVQGRDDHRMSWLTVWKTGTHLAVPGNPSMGVRRRRSREQRV